MPDIGLFLRLCLGIGLLVIAACQQRGVEQPASLGGACQFRKCFCEQAGTYFWEAEDRAVSWDSRGNAFCPEGYRLRLRSEP